MRSSFWMQGRQGEAIVPNGGQKPRLPAISLGWHLPLLAGSVYNRGQVFELFLFLGGTEFYEFY
ncbi:hypothetical protein [Vogesella urethralis]|uniref:hypothetical protein n=1 Tax=Vogesella urethralis TaxID=2592656 RepID=UPI001186C8A3|nr:hypothetical protein [Vogesella urethralis]